MNVLIRSAALLLIGMVFLTGMVSCMKKDCYSCHTLYPEVNSDTFYMIARTQRHCDITVEQREYLEGNRDTMILLGGTPTPVRITTTCEP